MDLTMIGAGIAFGMAALGTAIAMKDIGTAAVGAAAEKDSFFIRGLILTALPETIVILGMVVAFSIISKKDAQPSASPDHAPAPVHAPADVH